MYIENRYIAGMDSCQLNNDNSEIIAIGSERCVYNLPSESELMKIIERIHCIGKQVRLVTPKVPQEHFEKVKSIVRAAVNFGVDFITINDYGIMSECHSLWKESNIRVALGRGVSWCMEECPWYYNLLREEDEFVRQTCLMSNMENWNKLSLLESYGITDIELEGLPGVLGNVDIIRDKMNVTIHIDYPVISFSRVCHSMKFNGCTAPQCTGKCHEVLKLELNKGYDGKVPYPHLKDIDDELKSVIGDLYISGNMVLAPPIDVNTIKQYIKDEDIVVFNSSIMTEEQRNRILYILGRKGE